MIDDVKRMSMFALEIAVDDMEKAETLPELNECYKNAQAALEAVYDSKVADLENHA